jgi:hypothetical protein
MAKLLFGLSQALDDYVDRMVLSPPLRTLA